MAVLFTVITQLLELHCILSNLGLSSSFHEAWLWGGDSGLLCFPGWPPNKPRYLRQCFLVEVSWCTTLPQTLPKCVAKFWQHVKLLFFFYFSISVVMQFQKARLLKWAPNDVAHSQSPACCSQRSRVKVEPDSKLLLKKWEHVRSWPSEDLSGK